MRPGLLAAAPVAAHQGQPDYRQGETARPLALIPPAGRLLEGEKKSEAFEYSAAAKFHISSNNSYQSHCIFFLPSFTSGFGELQLQRRAAPVAPAHSASAPGTTPFTKIVPRSMQY